MYPNKSDDDIINVHEKEVCMETKIDDDIIFIHEKEVCIETKVTMII